MDVLIECAARHFLAPPYGAAAMEKAEVTVLTEGERLEAGSQKGYVLVRGRLKREVLTSAASNLRWRRGTRGMGKAYVARHTSSYALGSPSHGRGGDLTASPSGGKIPTLSTEETGDLKSHAEDVHGGDIMAPYIIEEGSYVSIAGAGVESLVLVLPDSFKSFGRSAGVMSKERFTRRALLMGNAAAVNTAMSVIEQLTALSAAAKGRGEGAGGGGDGSWTHTRAEVGTAWGLRDAAAGAAAAAGDEGEGAEDVEEGGGAGKAASFEDGVVVPTGA
jgi:hypothetical protein